MGLNLLMEKDASGTTKKTYTHGYSPIDGIGSIVVAHDSIHGYQYPTYDHRGTVQEVLDDAETVRNEYEHSGFGEEQERTEAETNRFTYQSNWYVVRSFDGEERYVGSQMRLYDAGQGRFLSRDFLRILNRYRCFGNSPPTQVDPEGLEEAEPYRPYIRPGKIGTTPPVRKKVYDPYIRPSENPGYRNVPINRDTGKPYGEPAPWYDYTKGPRDVVSWSEAAQRVLQAEIWLTDKDDVPTKDESEACKIRFAARIRDKVKVPTGPGRTVEVATGSWTSELNRLRGTWSVMHNGKVVAGPRWFLWMQKSDVMGSAFGGAGEHELKKRGVAKEVRAGTWVISAQVKNKGLPGSFTVARFLVVGSSSKTGK